MVCRLIKSIFKDANYEVKGGRFKSPMKSIPEITTSTLKSVHSAEGCWLPRKIYLFITYIYSWCILL